MATQTTPVKRGYGAPTSLKTSELQADLLTGNLYMGNEQSLPVLIGNDSNLSHSGILFWARVALGAFTIWMLLQVFDHIGNAIMLRQASHLLGNDPAAVGGLADFLPAAWVATVKLVEALAAIGTVTAIGMRSLLVTAARYLLVLVLGSPAKAGLSFLDRFFKKSPVAPAGGNLAVLISQLQQGNPVVPVAPQPVAPAPVAPVATPPVPPKPPAPQPVAPPTQPNV